MTILIIINDPPYGTEKAYNALRLANQLLRDHSEVTVHLFLMADAVGCGIAGQRTPEGYYNIERMMRIFASKGGQINACGTCMDARGVSDDVLMPEVRRSSMADLAQWTAEADKVISF